MSRMVLYIVIVLSLMAIPVQKSDVGDLLPVEVVSVYSEAGAVEIRTDTGNTGKGKSLLEASEDLKRSASDQIFLDTADYLILTGDSQALAEELRTYMRPRVRVCESEQQVDLEMAASYLSTHKPQYALSEINDHMDIEHLIQKEDGFELS